MCVKTTAFHSAYPHCFGPEDALAINPPIADPVDSKFTNEEEEEDEEEVENEGTTIPQLQKLKFRQISVGQHYSCVHLFFSNNCVHLFFRNLGLIMSNILVIRF